MPDLPQPKWGPREAAGRAARRSAAGDATPTPALWPYAELHCKTNFSFLRGASHPEELVDRASELGYRALAVTDRHSLAGVVRAHLAARRAGLKLLIGAEIVPRDAPPAVLLATDRAGYGRLSRLITTGRRRAIKGDCLLTFADVAEHADGLLTICLPDAEATARSRDDERMLTESLGRYREAFGDRAYLAAELCYGADDDARLARLAALADRAGLPLVAAGDVHFHDASRRPLHDVLTCIRHGCTIHTAGRRLSPNARRHLSEPADVHRRLAACPQAVERTLEAADRCRFSLDELRYEYPRELCPDDRTPTEYLAELTWAGARQRYGERLPTHVRQLLEHELALIRELGYEKYFLTVWDLVRFARERGILCQGRGSAANSAVCYCLGVTAVDPVKIDLLFERFVSKERNEPPDIDIDFEHERREEVYQYIYGKYGRERAALTAEVITYRPRSAVRDVGKALGLSLDCVDSLARRLDWWERQALPDDVIREAGLNPRDPTLRKLVELTTELMGFPRHLGQHVGGFVMTAGPLCETVPIENAAMPDRTFIEWDKDDLDALGMLKVDCLALGMLTCIRKCFGLIAGSAADGDSNGPAPPQSLADVPSEDPAVYDMICRADTVGVFQIESRAQMSMLPRLRPRNFYDLVIEVAIVRPGPIQGGMVHPYLRRRNGEEPVTFPSPAVASVLGKTLGVPLFQEQAMRLAVVAAGFSPGEADQLRRAMAAWKRHGGLDQLHQRFIRGMLANGYEPDFAERCFNQIRGFGEYGFPESHAASFALLVYVSAWLKRYHPAAFAAALINSQPMGFYAPAQIVRDAINHGVEVRPPDINAADYDCALEPTVSGGPALRLGLRLVRGISEERVASLVAARRADGPYRSVPELARRSRAARDTLARLAAADAFRSIGLSRREALWEVLALRDEPGLLDGLEPAEPPARLPCEELPERVVADYDAIGLSLTAHPISLARHELRAHGVSENRVLTRVGAGKRIAVSGLVLVRQRPGTARGVVFITLEDETATANLIVRPNVWDQYRSTARGAVALVAQGRVERQGAVVHVMVQRLENLSTWLHGLPSQARNFH